MLKKNLLVSAIASTLGVSSAVHAIAVSHSGIGDAILVPYYSTMSGNKTFLTITNNDSTTKAVKVRFREGVGSRDVFDFTLYLSAYDVWSALVIRTGDDTRIVTHDNSCTVPQVPNTPNAPIAFNTTRIPAEYEGNAADRVSEGHIEILEMAVMSNRGATDIRDAVTHANGDPENCDLVRSWTAEMALKDFYPESSPGDYNPANSSVVLGTEPVLTSTDSAAQVLLPPRSGLFAHAAVFNPTDGTYFTYAATALVGWGQEGILWFPQNATGLPELAPYTTDLGLGWDEGTGDDGLVEYFDLPDLSTPAVIPTGSTTFLGTRAINIFTTYSTSALGPTGTTTTTTHEIKRFSYQAGYACCSASGGVSGIYQVTDGATTVTPSVVTVPIGSYAAAAKRDMVTTALLRDALANDYITSSGYESEWLVAFPSRYLHVSVPADIDGDDEVEPDWVFATAPFTVPENAITGEACEVIPFEYWDREEGQVIDPGSVDFSPGGTVPNRFQLCYEVNVLAFNQSTGSQTSVLKSSTIAKYVGLESGYENGWAILDLEDFVLSHVRPPYNQGLPGVGFLAISDTTGSVPRGATYKHHQYDRINYGELTPP